MGLFDLLQRVAINLGLVNRATHSLPYISFLAAFAGIAVLLILPMDGQFRNTYISENALLPAQAHTYFRESEWNIVRGYREEVHLLEEKTQIEQTLAVKAWFEEIGLKTSIHNWDISYGSENKSGTNVYGILHAPRGENTEAMVLVAPWINKDGDYNDGGVSLVVSLARYLKKWSVWSKNIIFVVTSDSHFSMRSWVSDYHTSMENTAGAIEAAVVLDYPSKSDYFDEIEISYEGLNGQLPNLDLFNTAVIISSHENLRIIIQNMATVNFLHYKERAITLLRGIIAQLSAGLGPGPGSETFSGWRINAIALRARGTKGPADITTFGRVAESTLRSINNLLEHFHQSFFFYFLLAPRKFVSIGKYLPAAILLAIAYPLMAIYNIATAPTVVLTPSLPNLKTGNILSRNVNFFWNRATPPQIAVIVPFLLISSMFGISLVVGYLSLHVFSTRTVVIIIQIITGFHLLISLSILIETFKQNRLKITLNKDQFQPHSFSSNPANVYLPLNRFSEKWILKFPRSVLAFTQAYAMILHGLILTTLSMLNFSLAVLVGTATLPLMYITPHSPILSTLSLLISSPWAWLRVISWLTTTLGNKDSGLELITESLLWSWRGMGVWTWGIFVGVWLPFWLIGLLVATTGLKDENKNINAMDNKKK